MPHPSPRTTSSDVPTVTPPRRPARHQTQHDLRDGESVRLWSFRHPDEIVGLDRGDAIVADPDRVPRGFAPAYAWMSERLARLVPRPRGVTLPVWGWIRADGTARPRPDLRRSWGRSGEALVLVEYELPVRHVLSSDFDAWHFVLSGRPLPTDPEDDRRWEEALSGEGWPGYGPVPVSLESEVERTWEAVFDIDGEHHPDYRDPPHRVRVQGVSWSIPPNAVRSLRPFVSR